MPRAALSVLLALAAPLLFPAESASGAARFQTALTLAQTLDESALAGQVIMAGIDAKGALSEGEKQRLSAVQPGAVMLFGKNISSDLSQVSLMTGECAALLSLATEEGTLKPFLAIDHEGGSVQRFGKRTPLWLPPPLSYWEQAGDDGEEAALAAVYADSRASALSLRALGINLNLAPVAEPLEAQNAAFLGTRSYGPDASFVAAACAAFVRAMDEAGISCVLKHFPGNSATDPHRGVPILDVPAGTLQQMTSPFARVIAEAAPAAIMVSHAIVPAWDNERNASLSREVMEGRLREELGFTGIILADDFSMGALASLKSEEAAVQSLIAGADMVMAWPATLRSTHRTILAALAAGRLSRPRLLDAAAHIIAAKLPHPAPPP